jgi:hypothetical protein
MWATPFLGNLEGTYANQGQTEVAAGNRGGLMLCFPAEAAPKWAHNSTQLVQHYPATLVEVFRDFPQL